MNKELLLLTKKDTNTLIEQTKSRPQVCLEYKLNNRRKLFRLILH